MVATFVGEPKVESLIVSWPQSGQMSIAQVAEMLLRSVGAQGAKVSNCGWPWVPAAAS